MNLPQLNQQLRGGKVSPLYIFTGSETAIMDIYINQVAKAANSTIKRVDSFSSVFSKLKNNTISNEKWCYVISNDKEYLQKEKVWDSVIEGNSQGKHIIILTYPQLDKRGKFFKKHNEALIDAITEFEKMSLEVISKYTKSLTKMSDANCEKLGSLCNCSYGRVLMEADKLNHLSKATEMDINTTFALALSTNLIYTPPEDVVFELVDCVCTRKERKSFELWGQLKELKESPLAIISLLYTNFRSMLIVQNDSGASGICERTGLTPWQVKLAKEKIGAYTTGELLAAVRAIRFVEKGIKIGTVEQAIAVDTLLVQLLR